MDQLFLRGMSSLGCQSGPMPRNCLAPPGVCSSFCALGCATGHKRDTQTTWLADACENGAVCLTEAYAERVVTEPSSSMTKGKKSPWAIGLSRVFIWLDCLGSTWASQAWQSRRRPRGTVVLKWSPFKPREEEEESTATAASSDRRWRVKIAACSWSPRSAQDVAARPRRCPGRLSVAPCSQDLCCGGGDPHLCAFAAVR